MKKWSRLLPLALCILCVTGCGSEKEKESGKNTSGNAIVISEVTDPGQKIGDKELVQSQEGESPSEKTEAEESPHQKIPQDIPQKEEPSSLMEQPQQEEVVVDPSQLNEPEIAHQEVTEIVPEEHDENRLQIVFLGDSILDGYRNETGIAYLTGVRCDADVYNLAMGGTTAALTAYESAEYAKWTSRSLQGVVHAICGNVDSSILDGYRAGEVFDTCDFSQTDYFVIEYGMNDFLSGLTMNDEEDFYDEYTYVGALRIAIQKLRENFPEATIVLCSPNYAQFWGENREYLGDGNMVNNGGGTLVAYHRVCENVANDMHTLFLDGYNGIGLDAYTADDYLEDGIHLSQKGRDKYAEKLSEVILEYEATKNN